VKRRVEGSFGAQANLKISDEICFGAQVNLKK
jgi:hypothetical protein